MRSYVGLFSPRPSPSPTRTHQAMASSQLIPGLPDDVAMQCLLRLSAQELVRVQQVSPLWRIVIQGDRFYVERKRRQACPSIFIIRRMPDCYQCLDAGLEDLQSPRVLFSCAVFEGKKLFPPGMVFTTVESSVYGFAPGHQGQKFSLLTRRWTQLGKLFPLHCRFLISTVGHLVVVIAFQEEANGGEDDQEGVYGHGSAACEILDTHTDQWVQAEGLPNFFHGTHCFTHQGTVFVKEMGGAVYRLDLAKSRWKEDDHMSATLRPVGHAGKLILRPELILVTMNHLDTLTVRHHTVGENISMLDVVGIAIGSPWEHFFFEADRKFFLVVRSKVDSSCQIRSVFLYQGLWIFSIPCSELLMAGATVG